MTKRYIYLTFISISMTGCMSNLSLPFFHKKGMPSNVVEDTNSTQKNSSSAFGSMRRFNPDVDESYQDKPEPYSLASKQKDPELLGPQSTLKNNPLTDGSDESLETEDYDSSKRASSRAQIISEVYDDNSPKKRKHSTAITKNECISMLGVDRFNEYARKYGGESAALRRCAILKRLNG